MAGTVPRSCRARPVRAWLAPLLLAGGLAGAPVQAQAPSAEAEAKARFVVTLVRFAQWPASPAAERAAMRLCVVHRSPALAAAFASREGAPVTGRPLELVTGDAVRPAACDVLFIDASAGSGASEALVAFAGKPVLTLGTIDGFLSRGGMVELVNVDDTFRFDVALKPMRAAHLGLSSQALKLARRIQE